MEIMKSNPEIKLTLVPPSPVTDQIQLSIRGAVVNETAQETAVEATFYLDQPEISHRLHQERIVLAPNSRRGINFRWPTENHAGQHQIIFTANSGSGTRTVSRPIEIRRTGVRSTGTIDGAWCGFYHWSEEEGRLWNAEIKQMTPSQWRELARGMHEIGMNIIVPQELFRNQIHVGQHSIERDGYPGRAFYPSKLFPGRMPIETRDPIEEILAEADARDMFVFVPVGLYAWFDFTAGSLDWHKKVATELWNFYGHHPSFYGWYVSEEVEGTLSANRKDPEVMLRQQQEIVQFFKAFQAHVRALAPEKPVMLAPNCHRIHLGAEIYPKLLPYLDIICPFGFHRMPAGDIRGEEAATTLQKYCDAAGAHLWMDMEAFLFGPAEELYPRPIEGLLDDFHRFPIFEKILCYQYPGLFNAPWASRQPGGPATVKLFEDYKNYYLKIKI
jgi:hypothetical protein